MTSHLSRARTCTQPYHRCNHNEVAHAQKRVARGLDEARNLARAVATRAASSEEAKMTEPRTSLGRRRRVSVTRRKPRNVDILVSFSSLLDGTPRDAVHARIDHGTASPSRFPRAERRGVRFPRLSRSRRRLLTRTYSQVRKVILQPTDPGADPAQPRTPPPRPRTSSLSLRPSPRKRSSSTPSSPRSTPSSPPTPLQWT